MTDHATKRPTATGFYVTVSWSSTEVASLAASCGLCGHRLGPLNDLGMRQPLDAPDGAADMAELMLEHSRLCNTAIHGAHECLDLIEPTPPPKLSRPPTLVVPPANDVREIDLSLGPFKIVCGACGDSMEVAVTDPHWSTGRGPICPKVTKASSTASHGDVPSRRRDGVVR